MATQCHNKHVTCGWGGRSGHVRIRKVIISQPLSLDRQMSLILRQNIQSFFYNTTIILTAIVVVAHLETVTIFVHPRACLCQTIRHRISSLYHWFCVIQSHLSSLAAIRMTKFLKKKFCCEAYQSGIQQQKCPTPALVNQVLHPTSFSSPDGGGAACSSMAVMSTCSLMASR